MDKTILVGLNGHTERYRLDTNAYDRLRRYLDRAAVRLNDEADRDEVLGDLERSIGDRLAALPESGDRIVSAADVEGILDEIGVVDTGMGAEPDEDVRAPRRRRLQRIREGQEIAGVCNGLASYAEVDVDWVRTVFVLGTIVTAGILGLVYIALIFILPIAPKSAR
jgi:phage shock protein PspC (stress-responsive transcriptional regulator)